MNNKQMLRDTPLPRASFAGVPDLDPADAVHIPRWLDELRQAEVTARFSLQPLAGPCGRALLGPSG